MTAASIEVVRISGISMGAIFFAMACIYAAIRCLEAGLVHRTEDTEDTEK